LSLFQTENMNVPMHSRVRGAGAAGAERPRAAAVGAPDGKGPTSSRGGLAAQRGGATPVGMRANPAVSGRRGGSSAEAAPVHRTASAGWAELPSARLKNVKCADPFATKAEQFKTKFASAFNSGGIPCRLWHGAANVSIKWSKDPSLLDFDPLLVTCAEGLCETEHPYAFASRACFRELLASEDGGVKATPLVARIVPSLRAALVSPNKLVFAGGVEAVIQLSEAVRDAMNPHIHILVVQMNKRNSDRDLAPNILKAMQTLEENGGPDALEKIKAKVPTYAGVL
jgi:hypothetical protein